MARTTKEIYNELVDKKDEYLELKEANSRSKVSVINSIFWIVAGAIRTLEALVDVAAIDIGGTINSRINVPQVYYANALLKYQHGDELNIQDNGIRFGYNNIDESKRIITKVAFTEMASDISKGNRILYKVATGKQGSLKPITEEQLVSVKAYISKIKFAGTELDVTSKSGDVLLPRLTVYHSGQLEESEMLDKISDSLYAYMSKLTFDATVRKKDIINAIKATKHVIDVYIDKSTEPEGGIFIARYDDNGEIKDAEEIDRIMDLASGYLVESSRTGKEANLPSFKECITLKVE